MYPHKEDFLDTVKDYIDFSQNETLWKEMDRMSGLGMSILEEGIEKGIEKGKTEGRREDIICMLENNKSPEQIAEFCGYDLEYVKTIQEELLQPEQK